MRTKNTGFGNMNDKSSDVENELTKLHQLIEKLDKRVSRLEDVMRAEIPSESTPAFQRTDFSESRQEMSESLEFKIGEFWLARVGTLVLLFGIAFLVSYPFVNISAWVISLTAYLLVGAIFWLSRYWRDTYGYLSGLLFGGGLLLLYFVTLRLHFFTTQPVLESKAIAIALLTIVLAAILYLAVKRQGELIVALSLVLCFITSLISDTTHFSLVFTGLVSAAAVYLVLRFNWPRTLVTAIVFAYLTHLIWMMNNPVLGKPMQALAEHHNNSIYVFIYGSLFSVPFLVADKSRFSNLWELALTTLNSVGMFVIIMLSAITFFKESLGIMNLVMSALFLTFAIAIWVRRERKYVSAVYACFGFMSLSVAIFVQFSAPEYYIWLSLQSLAVISVAIWFRSRLIIIVNSLIYACIFLAYLLMAPSNDFVNLSYAIVALASARILNWKRERLELRTDMIRNGYLASAFIVVLYGLHQAVPASWISLAWLGAAVFYFGMSLLLNNMKYRWLFFLTALATIIRVFFFDMARMNAELRIVLFIAEGLVLLALSLFYARRKKRLNLPKDRQG